MFTLANALGFARHVVVAAACINGIAMSTAAAQAPLRITSDRFATIDQNRAAVVDRVVAQWGDILAKSNTGITTEQLRAMLLVMRPHYLLMASIAGSLDALRTVVAISLIGDESAPSPIVAGGSVTKVSPAVGGTVGINVAGENCGSACANRWTDVFGTIGGGAGNQAGNGTGTEIDAALATVGGGADNVAGGFFATVSGGGRNFATGYGAAVGGGENNNASGGVAVIGGGAHNIASGDSAFIGGGGGNRALGDSVTIGGGFNNIVTDVPTGIPQAPTIGFGTIGGGLSNTASGSYSTIGGGTINQASGFSATIAGGNTGVASGEYATVAGGRNNTASGLFSFAAGRRAKTQTADATPDVHDGVFIFADSSDFDFNSSTSNEFTARATGGVRFVTAIDGTGAPTKEVSFDTNGNVIASGTFNPMSDRNAKEGFAELDARVILEKVAGLPLSVWRYKSDSDGAMHMGPMAQDFRAAFGLGTDDKHIATVDADGVALAAIQGLKMKLDEQQKATRDKDAKIEAQANRVREMELRAAGLEERILALEATRDAVRQ